MARNKRNKKLKKADKGKNTKAKASKGSSEPLYGIQYEIFGIILSVATIILLLALASFDPSDPVLDDAGAKASNLIGLVGAYMAHALLYLLGISSFLLVVGLGYAAAVAFGRGALRVTFKKVIGYFALLIQGTALVHILLAGSILMGHAPGGVFGEYTAGLFVSLLSSTGSILLLAAGLIMALVATTGFSLVDTFMAFFRVMKSLFHWIIKGMAWFSFRFASLCATGGRASATWLGKQAKEFAGTLRFQGERLQPVTNPPAVSVPPIVVDEPEQNEQTEQSKSSLFQGFLQPPISCPPPLGRREPVVVTGQQDDQDSQQGPTEMDDPFISSGVMKPSSLPEKPQPEKKPDEKKPDEKKPEQVESRKEPEIVIPAPKDSAIEEQQQAPLGNSPNWSNYQLPSLDMLESEEQPQEPEEIDKNLLTQYAKRLEQKLSDYGIKGQVTKIMPGPVVTMYEYAPGPGIKVAKISGLSQDLALALEAMSVRIIAPIPGRAVVGIEVSNKKRKIVYAKEIVGHKSFQRAGSKLTMALGKDIEGTPCVTDLNKMPHLLVAGATGTGKSVALNCMITSILYKATPEDVRFIMVDPKVLELSLYEGIPHLLLPVVTDPKKAQAALNWAVNEMERRIQLLHGAGVRNLDSYNRKAEKQAEAREKNGLGAPARKKIVVIDKTAEKDDDELLEIDVDEESEFVAPGEDEVKLEKMPHIIIVIDELADLMMTAGRDVETSIARIAQKARAAGIHLIVATQRPSVNVITGLIKANLPARVSFRVASKVDSRTILDANGAEALLGNGDMLFSPPTTSELKRIHGAFITEDEIQKVVEHIKAQAEPVYDQSIIAAAEKQDEDNGPDSQPEDHDELYDVAVQMVAEMGQASTSMVQRKLRIGYNRAARLIEQMEKEGIVGPPDGSRPRKVLIQNHEP